MKKMKDSCFNEFDPNAMSVEAALENILKSISSIKTSEYVDLKSAYGRILSKNIKSKINVPNYKNSAMDGYAVNVSDFNEKNKTYDCIGESFAGNPFLKPVKKNQAIKVMTGGMVPSGCNAVVMKELITQKGRIITTKSKIIKDQNIRFPGEDIKKNEIVLKAGKEIDEIDIGILASLGIDRVSVKKRPIIGFVSTGDELVSIKKPIKISQVYDSNRYLLHGLLKKYPVEIKDYGVVKDKIKSIEKKFLEASLNCDVLITTGGVSVGDADYVKEVLEKLGKVNFWKIAVKPGRPLAYGKIKKCIFFGLPGNPVSVVVTFNLFVNAALNKLMGKGQDHTLSLEAELLTSVKKRKGRKEYKRGVLISKKNKLYVRKSGLQGSNILSSVKDANCYIELGENMREVPKGAKVKVLPFKLTSEYYEH
jgi:molybdopterin molybdotransferase|tara:strand:- start:379 stop:1644 length:1266 start_codon:yes stop_codon:yes gene_type:complete